VSETKPESDPTPEASAAPRFAVVALILAILGLCLAALPPFALEGPEQRAVTPLPKTAQAEPSPSPKKKGLKAALGRLKTKATGAKAKFDAHLEARKRHKEDVALAESEFSDARQDHAALLLLCLQVGGGLGVLGILLGLIALWKQEPAIPSTLAIALGVLAALWFYVLVAIAVAFVILIVVNFFRG
jgi:hypothetical protein